MDFTQLHGRTNELSSSVVPQSNAWVAKGRLVEEDTI
jgi:hypothetical protein